MSEELQVDGKLKGPFAEVYRSRKTQQWRWRIKARNGRVIATSHDAYYNQEDCIHGLHLTLNMSAGGTEVRIENTKPPKDSPMGVLLETAKGMNKVIPSEGLAQIIKDIEG
jgi:uncharacterized protein YegP (UPF0339 family)